MTLYQKSFYLTDPLGNNAFNYETKKIKKLFIPKLRTITDFQEIRLWAEVVFSDFDFEDNLIEATGLEDFYHFEWKNKDVYLFDNHNHALYFWYLARHQGKIGNNNLLIHIDEHSDMRDPEVYLSSEESKNMQKVFEYVNFTLNVGNYIIPAQKEGIVGEVFQVRNEENLQNYLERFTKKTQTWEQKSGVICNIDLDFFEPALDFIDYDLKMRVVRDALERADVITFATSPFFIDQSLALKVFFDIFDQEKKKTV